MNKIKNIFTALYVLCVSGLKRIFIIKSKRPYCVIVFHTGKLGDMVCATPIFRAIKQSYPSSKVIVFGNKVNKDIVKYNDNVDHYEIIQGSIKDNIRNINRYYADYAILLTPGFNSISSLLLSNVRSISVPRIVNGFSPYETKTYRLLSLLTNRVEHRMGNYAPREYLKLLRPLGINTENTEKDIFFSDDSKRDIEVLLKKINPQNKRIVAMSLAAGNKIKEWGVDNFKNLSQMILMHHDVLIAIVGTKADMDHSHQFLRDNKFADKIVDLTNQFDIDKLKAFLSRVYIFISVDTGPIYIAEALKIKTIDIVGPMDEREQPPIGPNNRVIFAKREKAQLHIMNSRVYDIKEAKRQVESITAEQVYKSFQSLI